MCLATHMGNVFELVSGIWVLVRVIFHGQLPIHPPATYWAKIYPKMQWLGNKANRLLRPYTQVRIRQRGEGSTTVYYTVSLRKNLIKKKTNKKSTLSIAVTFRCNFQIFTFSKMLTHLNFLLLLNARVMANWLGDPTHGPTLLLSCRLSSTLPH